MRINGWISFCQKFMARTFNCSSCILVQRRSQLHSPYWFIGGLFRSLTLVQYDSSVWGREGTYIGLLTLTLRTLPEFSMIYQTFKLLIITPLYLTFQILVRSFANQSSWSCSWRVSHCCLSILFPKYLCISKWPLASRDCLRELTYWFRIPR